MKNLLGKIKTVPYYVWILVAITVVGAFLRTYKLEEWLYFYPDQERDLRIVEGVLNGTGDWPLLGFKAASTNFQLGAAYSYFQIVSGKIFGATPATMAYPDVFFGILTIPLLFYFLKKYFSTNISLALAGLYSVSFYAIRYSRFAWNTNPIPFFAILLLLALYHFLVEKEKVRWIWVIAAGLALGINVQLHTVLLVLLPILLFLLIVYTIKKSPGIWKKWIIVLLLALVLNIGQIISEMRTGFENTKYFFSILDDRSPGESSSMAKSLVANVVCQSQANVLYLTSLENQDNCETLKSLDYDTGAKRDKTGFFISAGSLIFGFLILIFGYVALIYYLKKERDEKKKIFLALNLIYGALAFLVILPIITHNGQVRYWLPVIFLPFLFLGLIMQPFAKLKLKKWLWIAILVVLAAANFSTIIFEADRHASKTRSSATYVVLGELWSISSYIKAQSYPQKEAYVFGGQKYMQNIFRPLDYVTSDKDFTLNRIGGSKPDGKVPPGMPFFFIAQSVDAESHSSTDASPSDFKLEVESYKKFGNIGVYKIKD